MREKYLSERGKQKSENVHRYEASLAVELICTFLKRRCQLSGLLLDVGVAQSRTEIVPHAHYYGIDRAGKSSDVCGDLLRLPVGNRK